MSYALRFLTATLAKQEVGEFLRFGALDHLFDLDPVSQPTYQFVKDYLDTSGELPTIDLVETETNVVLKIEDASCNYLHQKAFEEWTKRTLKLAQAEANQHFADDPLQAHKILLAAGHLVEEKQNAPQISNFKDAATSLYPYLVNKWTNKDAIASFGWKYLDDQSGGIMPDDLISFVGRPQQGKTWFLLRMALHVWKTMMKPIVFVTMEMSKEAIMERLAAIWTGTAMNFFKFGQAASLLPGKAGAKIVNPKQQLKVQLNALQAGDMPDFIIVDGNLAGTVDDVAAVCRQYRPAMCFIDGAYILDNAEAKGIYDAVARNVKLIKRKICTALQTPCACTWQFAKIEDKLKKGAKPTLENIGYSDAIAQFSAVVLGLFEDDDPGNVQSLFQRLITVLKGRNGEVGEFRVLWDFVRMLFDQVEPEAKVVLWN